MEENTQKSSAVWYTVGAIIIVIAAYLLFFKSPTETIAPSEGTVATTTSATSSSTQASLIINDQFSTSTVTVDKVVTSAEGWVVVHEDRGGKPGNILGAAWVPAGETLNLTVELLRGAVEGQTYYAMIHAEDGVTGFDFKTDLPVTDTSGNPVMKSYKVIFDKG